jgi:isopentenyldiphosphate isomerase
VTELFDIYDEDLNHIGIKSREDVHRDGDWHMGFHCWVIGRDDKGECFVILQKRAPDKDTFPDKIDISAAGHLEAGETVEDGQRELQEELGLVVPFDDLVSLGRRVSIKKYKTLTDCEIVNVFLYECNQPLNAYNYQAEEISGLVKLSIDDGLRLFSGEVDRLTVDAVGLGQDKIEITTNDFVPSIDNYGYKIMVLAKRYFAGEQHLLI